MEAPPEIPESVESAIYSYYSAAGVEDVYLNLHPDFSDDGEAVYQFWRVYANGDSEESTSYYHADDGSFEFYGDLEPEEVDE